MISYLSVSRTPIIYELFSSTLVKLISHNKRQTKLEGKDRRGRSQRILKVPSTSLDNLH